MAPPVDPEHRLRNLARRLRDLLMGRRLSADPERTGVVSLGDFGLKCDKVAELAGESVVELAARRSEAARCAARLCEELELAARAAALLETLPRTPARIDRQCELLEEVQARIAAALEGEEVSLPEDIAVLSLSALVGDERELFAPFVTFSGELEPARPGRIDAGRVRRRLRRALLEHAEAGEGPFRLEVDGDGVLRFGEFEFRAEPVAASEARFERAAHEPPEVRKILDLREQAPDEALADFLLVKAVDETLLAVLQPHLSGNALATKARNLPRRPGKRFAVRPEAVASDIEGWDRAEAARGVEKVAARRAGPEWARLPKGAYLLRLFLGADEALTADLLALGPALKRMEKGEAAPGARERGERALRALLSRLG